MRSAIYTGVVSHARLRPLRHSFRYRVFSMLLDLDELPAIDRRLKLFSVDKPNLFSFRARDHAAGAAHALKDWAIAECAGAGVSVTRVELLCFPRIFGYVFNPLSIFYCYDADDRIAAVIHEVRNTFGDRHCYVLPAQTESRADIRQDCAKRFYVSPFMAIAGRYRFRLRRPDARLSVAIRLDGPRDSMVATQSGRREPLSDALLFRRLFTHPLMTVKVILAIHWQAFKLWRKGAPLHRRPQPGATGATPQEGGEHV